MKLYRLKGQHTIVFICAVCDVYEAMAIIAKNGGYVTGRNGNNIYTEQFTYEVRF